MDDEEPAAATESRFVDIASQEWWLPYVERLADLRVTSGCSTEPLNFCPYQPVNRGQMATFLSRAFGLLKTDTLSFVDIEGNTHASSINRLAAAGVTVGCSSETSRYCPDKLVTKAQMATFLNRTIHWHTTIQNEQPVSQTIGVTRLFGTDRYETSLAVARAYANERGGRLDSVVLVSGTSWSDAAAAGLAGRLDAPVLLVGSKGLSRDTRSFLRDAGVSEIVAVGSHSAIPVSVLEDLSTLDPQVERIAAADRYSASVAVAHRMASPGILADRGRTVILASGEALLGDC